MIERDEVELAMEIGERLKHEFAALARTASMTGEQRGDADHIVRQALIAEALLLAACLHTSQHGSVKRFVAMAEVTFASAAMDKNRVLS
jgi:hypothetical protein